MKLTDLKNFINNNTVPSDFMIFVSKDSKFLVNQYVKALSDLAAGGTRKVSSIYEPQQSSVALLTAQEDTLNILTVEVFSERSEDYSQFDNTIVVCEQLDKSIAKDVEEYTVVFPKLEEWQIFDYAKKLCPNVDDDDLSWLIKAANLDIERVVNELDKVTIFDKAEQKAIFNSIRFDPQSDLYNIDLFAVVNALVNGDSLVLLDYLIHNNFDALEPVVLANRALTSLKNIILVTQNPNLTAEDCGVSAGQFRFLKYAYRSLDVNAVKEKIKFLTKFDFYLKTSRLELSKRDMLSYLISNLNYKITR